MRTIIFSIAVLLTSTFWLSAQQDAMYSQYMFNTLSVNPAYAGSKGALNIIVLSRNQWVGFAGAPKTNSITIHSPLPKTNVGVGFSIVKDKIGPLDVTNMFFDVASKIRLTWDGYLSLGMKFGFDARKTSLSNLNPMIDEDPKYNSDLVSKLNPNLGAGVYYYHKDYYAGLSIPKLLNRKIKDDDLSDGTSKLVDRHYFFIGGYIYEINEDYQLKPSFLYKKVKAAPSSFDLTMACMYKDKVIAGLTNRFGDSFGLMVQVRAAQQLWFGYSYDFTTSGLGKYNSGTHELMLYLDTSLLKKGIIKSPRFF